MNKNKIPDQTTESNTLIISAPIVEKHFVKKNGEVTELTEFYIRRSIQDYFIKICESKITKAQLLELVVIEHDFPEAISMEVEFRNGLLDDCDIDNETQSRTGEYVIIHKIL